MTRRPAISDLGLASGKRSRLHRILHQHGPRNGTALFLPYDQGLEHGPRDFFANPAAADPRYILKLAVEGGFNGIAIQIGVAEKFYWEFAGEVPLILKLNGKTEIPPDDEPLSPLNATVEDAVRLGADAVGYTLYVGSPRQTDDFAQFRQVRRDAERFGVPVVVWTYPRGSAVARAGGKTSFYAVDYAARVAAELGADVIKVTYPDPESRTGVRREYDRPFAIEEALAAITRSAGRSLVVMSGGDKAEDKAVLERARLGLEAGWTGVIIGRNVWQREHDAGLRFVNSLRQLLETHDGQ